MVATRYECIHAKRTGDKPDGCAIAWKKDKFVIAPLEGKFAIHRPLQIVDFNQLATTKFFPERDAVKFLRNNVGMFVALQHIRSKRVCCVHHICLNRNEMMRCEMMV
jgi:hypothetical protein